eukprot:3215014-Amphidinium_carterae.1
MHSGPQELAKWLHAQRPMQQKNSFSVLSRTYPRCTEPSHPSDEQQLWLLSEVKSQSWLSREGKDIVLEVVCLPAWSTRCCEHRCHHVTRRDRH